MIEKKFQKAVKNWLEEQGYQILRILRANDVELDGKPYVISFNTIYVKQLQELEDGFPDFLAIKDGKVEMFEVKAKLTSKTSDQNRFTDTDRSIGQCLRYVAGYPFDRIKLVVPEGIKGLSVFKEVVRRLNLPITIVELKI